MASEIVHRCWIFQALPFFEAARKPGYLCWKQEAAPGGPFSFMPAPTLYLSDTESQINQH